MFDGSGGERFISVPFCLEKIDRRKNENVLDFGGRIRAWGYPGPGLRNGRAMFRESGENIVLDFRKVKPLVETLLKLY